MTPILRRSFLRRAGLPAALLPLIHGLPSLGLAAPARPREPPRPQRLVDLCHSRGCQVLIDGAHALGALEVNLKARGPPPPGSREGFFGSLHAGGVRRPGPRA